MVSSLCFGLDSLALPGSSPLCNLPNTCTSEDRQRRWPDCRHFGRGPVRRMMDNESSSFPSDAAQGRRDLGFETRAAWDRKVAAQISASAEIPPAYSAP